MRNFFKHVISLARHLISSHKRRNNINNFFIEALQGYRFEPVDFYSKKVLLFILSREWALFNEDFARELI